MSGKISVGATLTGLLLICLPALSQGEGGPGKAWTVLEAGLRDDKADKRIQAVAALGLMSGDKKAIEAAEHELQDPDSNVCRAAIGALGDMDSKASLPKLKALIAHSDAKTIVAIAAVLVKFKDPEGYEIYYELITGKRKGGGSIVDGIKDKKAIEKMGVETAIGIAPFGGVATGAYGYFKQNGSSQSSVEAIAVSALAEDRDPEAEKALVQASFGGKEGVQVAALRALAKRGDASVVDDIAPAIYSDKSLIRYTAAATILHLLDQRRHQA
jgi:HEAT repeat protein